MCYRTGRFRNRAAGFRDGGSWVIGQSGLGTLYIYIYIYTWYNGIIYIYIYIYIAVGFKDSGTRDFFPVLGES